MISRKVGFEVVYQVGPKEWKREPVLAISFSGESGYDEARTPTSENVQINPLYASLLQFTGDFDKDGMPIFHAHILATENGDLYEVTYYNGGFHLVKNQGEDVRELSNDLCMTLKIVGDSIQNADMLVPDEPEEIMEESKERREPEV